MELEPSPKRESYRAELRAKLNEAKHRYDEDPSQENRLEYLRLLKLFANVVLRKAVPPEAVEPTSTRVNTRLPFPES